MTIWLPDDLREWLDELARHEGVTLSATIRRLVDQGLHERALEFEQEALYALYGDEVSTRAQLLRWGRIPNPSSPEGRLMLQEWHALVDGPWSRWGEGFLPYSGIDKLLEGTRFLAPYGKARLRLARRCRQDDHFRLPDLALAVTSKASFYVEAYVEVRGEAWVLTRLGRLMIEGSYRGYRWPKPRFEVAWPYPRGWSEEVPLGRDPNGIEPDLAQEIFSYLLALSWVQAWRRMAENLTPPGAEPVVPDPQDVGAKAPGPVALARLTVAEPEGRGRGRRWRLWRDQLALPPASKLPSWGPQLAEGAFGLSVDVIGRLIRQGLEAQRLFDEASQWELKWRSEPNGDYGPYVLREFWDRAEHLRQRLVANAWDPIPWVLDWQPCVESMVDGARLAPSLFRRFHAHYGVSVAANEYRDYAEAEMVRKALAARLQEAAWGGA